MLLSAMLISGIAGYVVDLFGKGGRGPNSPVRAASARKAPRTTVPVAETAQNEKLFFRAGGTTLVCVAAAPVVPAALLLAPAIAVVGTMPFLRSAVAHWKAKRRANDEAVSVLTLLGVVSIQNFLAVGLAMMLWWLRQALYVATKDRSRREIGELFGRSVPTAWLVVDGQETEVAIERLAQGDLIAVHAGEVIPVDGMVSDGAGRADQRMLTGEEFPADLAAGVPVHAMTMLLSGRIVVRVERAGAETTAGRILALLNRTTEHRLSTEIEAKRIADRLAPYYFGFGVAATPFLGLYGASCAMMTLPGPWALMVAAPLGMLHTLSRAGRQGIAIMEGRTLEMLPRIDTVVFDKTGTLTGKVPALAGIVCTDGVSETEILRWSASAEHRQSHPVALAIRAAAAGLAVPDPEDVDYVVSNGVQARVEGGLVLVGSARYMAAMGVAIPQAASAVERLVEGDGHMAVHVARDGAHAAIITLRTQIREEARDVVAALQARGIAVRILSGDGTAPTAAVARELGVEAFDAEVLPDQKSAVIARLRAEGRFVCFVGDGINDVVAMREAHVSVAVAGATDAATAVAGVIIYDDDLRHVLDLLEIGQMFRRRTRQSLAISTLPAIPAMAVTMFMGAGMLTALAFFYATIIAGSAAFLRPWPKRLSRRRRTGQIAMAALAPRCLIANARRADAG